MDLIKFQVLDYRSIADSGTINVDRITALVGRNESGKSNLLRALNGVEPADGFAALNKTKDFPRHRKLTDCKDATVAVRTWWKLEKWERTELQKLLPRAAAVEVVQVVRHYGAHRSVLFEGIEPLSYDPAQLTKRSRDLQPGLELAADGLEGDKQTALKNASNALQTALTPKGVALEWAKAAAAGIVTYKKALLSAEGRLPDATQQTLDQIQETAAQITDDAPAQAKASEWILKYLPIFIFLDDYPEIPGQQNIARYLERKQANPSQLKSSDKYFEKLLSVAGLSAEELSKLKDSNDAETRNLLVNRASSVVTAELKRLWKDRQLKVRFNIDGDHFETLISDPTDTYDVEVNLNERSRGFRWFFSFYITFAADTSDGSADGAILLLDEPGLFLHALSQDDLLRHFEDDFANQILYTTHSPFMIPPRLLSSVRTVNIEMEKGTTVTNEPTGDRRTLFPLQSALGYSIAQSLFVSAQNLVVEGVTDFWILTSVSEYLKTQGRTSLLDGIAIAPAGTAQKASYMVSLLTSQNLNAIVLLDDETRSRVERDGIVKGRIAKPEDIIFASDAFDPKPDEADVEDVIGEDIYLNLVRESYAAELVGKTLEMNPNIPRIGKRVEDAFKKLDLKLHHTRPASLFMRKMGSTPADVTNPAMLDRFERLFKILNERMAAKSASEKKPFS